MSAQPHPEGYPKGLASPAESSGRPLSEQLSRPGTTGGQSRRSRGWIFALLCVACAAVTVGSVAMALWRANATAKQSQVESKVDVSAIAGVDGQPHLLFLQTNGDAFRQVSLTALDTPEPRPQIMELQCQRLHFAAGRGLCLGQDPYRGGAFIFDAEFQVRHTLPANGIPSRARVSADGRYGAMTVFVQGHSYAQGGFSTQTTLVDMATGTVLADLEEFTVFRDDAPFHAVDFNFWGVTFARESNRFYATLATEGKTYLIEGDLEARQAYVLRENVECPSLSPDNTRLVFKKRVDNPGLEVTWRLHVLDLATMAERPLVETRNVDDQVEWLDDHHVVYALPDEGPPPTIRPDLWVASVDGSDPPRRLLTQALSPAIIR